MANGPGDACFLNPVLIRITNDEVGQCWEGKSGLPLRDLWLSSLSPITTY